MNTTPEPFQRSSVVAYVCSASDCDEIATVLIERETQAESPLCGEHWQAARVLADHPLSAVMVLPRPRCFVATCHAPAIEVVVNLDGTYLPCCETHLEDLSWVTPEPSDCESGDA
jgi:hypothetical protein